MSVAESVLNQIRTACGDTGTTTISNRELEAASGWASRTVVYALRNLKTQGHITVSYLPDRTRVITLN